MRILLSFLGTLLALALVLWRLRRANLRKDLRHRQLWSPILALLLTAAVLYATWRIGGTFGREWARLMAQADAFLARAGVRVRAGAVVALGINLFLLTVYLALKQAVNWVIPFFSRWMKGFGVFPAYDEHPEQGVVLKAEWIYPGMLFRAAGWAVGGAFLFLMVVEGILVDLPVVALPRFPALAVILLLEAGWYLDGTPASSAAGDVRGRGVGSGRAGDYTPLWEEYQRIWPEHVLAASAAVRLAPTPAAAVARSRLPGEGDETQQAVTGVWHDLVAARHPLSDAHYHVLEQLWRARDVLLTEADYAGAGPVLFAFLNRVLVDGHTVLVLIPSARRAEPDACAELEGWLREGLHSAAGGGAAWSLAPFDAFQQRSTVPDVLIAAPEELMGRGVTQDPWFSRLHAVVILEGARTVFEAPLRTDALMRVLRHRRPGIQQVVLSGDRAALESALRDNLAGQPGEHRPPRPAPESAFAIVWSLETLPGATGSVERFQDRVLLGSAGADLGAEAVLALPAWRDHVSPIHLVDQDALPWREYVEELENHRAGLMPPVPASALAGTAHEVVQVPPLPHLLPRRERAFVLARDRDRNLVGALRTWLPLGTESAFVHVVSPPYLLRDYLAANLEYFAQAPLLALSPRIADSRLVVSLTLLERMTTAWLTEHEVLGQLRAVVPGARHVEETLATVFRDVLGIDPVESNLLAIQRRTRFDERQDGFVEEVAYRLSPEIKEYDALAWLRRYRIVDRGEHVLGWIEQDRLYQTCLPGQVHAFQGKPFKVEWVDPASGNVWVDHESAGEHTAYRAARMVEIAEVRPSEQRAHHERRVDGVWEVDAALCRGTFRVRTPGYYTVGRDLRLANGAAAFTELQPGQVPEREYRDGRLLRLRLTPMGKLDAAARDRAADTLAVLFQEAFQTLFPETHAFLLACAPGSAERWTGNVVQALMPLMGADPAPPDAPAETGARGEPIVLYFVEDAHAPLGLVLSLFDRRGEVLALLEDYLSWVLEDEKRTEEEWTRPRLERTRYLSFGGKGPLTSLDLAGAHAVLRSLLRNHNPRREERRAYFRGERRGAGEGAEGTRQCDFCGRVLAAAEFDQLEDGRERCAACKATAVDSVPELKKAFTDARQFLVHHLGERIRRDVQVQFGGAAEIGEAAGKRFMPTAEFDRRSTGLAEREGNRFSILVENGQPYHTLLAVLVHELTHIWQFSYLDYERMREEHGLLLIEGHAQWAALECLRRRGLAPEYVAGEEARSDVYGHGYRLVQEYARRYADRGDAFDVLLSLYPAK